MVELAVCGCVAMVAVEVGSEAVVAAAAEVGLGVQVGAVVDGLNTDVAAVVPVGVDGLMATWADAVAGAGAAATVPAVVLGIAAMVPVVRNPVVGQSRLVVRVVAAVVDEGNAMIAVGLTGSPIEIAQGMIVVGVEEGMANTES